MIGTKSFAKIFFMMTSLVFFYAVLLTESRPEEFPYLIAGFLCAFAAGVFCLPVLVERGNMRGEAEPLAYKLYFVTLALLLIGILLAKPYLVSIEGMVYSTPDALLKSAVLCGVFMFIVIWVLACMYVYFWTFVKGIISDIKLRKHLLKYPGVN